LRIGEITVMICPPKAARHQNNGKGKAVLDNEMLSLMERLSARSTSLAPRTRIDADYILQNSRKVIFMTIKQLALACRVSESSVVRFVGPMGYQGYPDFIQSLCCLPVGSSSGKRCPEVMP